LTAALKADPKDTWALRALARQALCDPASVPDRKTLLPGLAALVKEQDALTLRLYGGLLLRTGSAKEAVDTLQTAIKKRAKDAAPVEELLLALAFLQCNEPAKAREQRQTADAWLQQGVQARKAASLAALLAGGPLQALAAVAVTPPTVRLESLDRQTAEELLALRAEAKKALPKDK
jgi:hypothetical protein